MKPRPSGAYRALLLSGVLLLIQIGLGNIVVNSDLNAAVTALHLANATALFGVMVVSGVLIRSEERSRRHTSAATRQKAKSGVPPVAPGASQ